MKHLLFALLALALFTTPAFATVIVASPANGSTVGPNVQFTASATTPCSGGVAAMGVYINNDLKFVGGGANLNTTVSLGPGTYNAVVQEWDYCGGATTTPETISVNNQTGVFVSSPANNSTVSNPANFVATATSGCAQGVAAMGVYVNNQRVYLTQGAKVNTQLSLGAGTQNAVVQEWDNCGGSSTTPVTVNVQGGGNVLGSIQASGGWNQWGELPPTLAICNPCSGVTWSMNQHQSGVSLSGNATQFNVGGSTPYSDALFSNPIMGQGSTSLPDTARTLIPNLHNFTYNADVYVTNASITQSLEFDVNMYLNGVGMEWGTQCNHLADGDWDIWDNVDAKWVSTGAPCVLNNGWNHVTLQVQRESNNDLLYQSITMGGVTYNINMTEAPFQVPSGWYGMTVNYQMDGNFQQAANTTYVDNLTLNYW